MGGASCWWGYEYKRFFNDVVVNELKIELWGKNCIAYFSPTKMGEMEK